MFFFSKKKSQEAHLENKIIHIKQKMQSCNLILFLFKVDGYTNYTVMRQAGHAQGDVIQSNRTTVFN